MKSYRSHLSLRQRQILFNCFVEDALVATKPGSLYQRGAAERAGLHSPKTAHAWYRYFREQIYTHQSKLTHLSGTIEIDHHTFNARRKKRWRSVGEPDAAGKYRYEIVPTKSVRVFGLLERHRRTEHRVFVQVVQRLDRRTTEPIIRHVVDAGSMLYSDTARTFSGLPGYTHQRVNHARGKYARREGSEIITTATIDQFWQYCDRRLGRFNGLPASTIHLHIQECAFRYNHRHDLRRALRAVLK